VVDYRSSPDSSACRTPLRGSFWACRHATTSVLHSRHYTGCPFITGYSSRSRYSCTMHSLAGVRSTSRTSWHLTPVDSNYDQPPDQTSLFLVAEQSSAVVPSQQLDQKCGTVPSPAVRSFSRYCQTVQTITENSLLPAAFRS